MERHKPDNNNKQSKLRQLGLGRLVLTASAVGCLGFWLHFNGVEELSTPLASCPETRTGLAADQDCARVHARELQLTSQESASGGAQAHSAAGLPRASIADPVIAAADQTALSDIASASFRPQAVSRQRYMTISERCKLGLADPSLRCGAGSGPLGTSTTEDPAGAPDTLRISGRVITADGYGIAGVTLIASRIGVSGDQGESDSSAVRSERYTRYRAVSGADGSYSFDAIPDGDYTIRSNRHDDYASRRITVRAGVDYADLVLAEQRSFFLEGTVTDEYGLPLSHVSVLPVVAGSPSVRTDLSGRYRLPISLSPSAGSITLRFESAGFHEASLTAALPRESVSPSFGVSVRLDAELQSIQLTTNVRGTVSSSTGEPVAGQVVELTAVREQRRLRAVTDRNGNYEFPVVSAPLAYRLRVAGQPEHADYQSEIRVTRDNYEFDVTLEPYQFGTLRGRILDADGAPVPDLELGFRNTASAENNAVIRSDMVGNFVLQDVPAGDAILSSRAMPNFVVRGLRVEPDGESTVEVVLDSGGHELTGRVVDRYGRPVPASRVLLEWAHESDGIKSSATRRTATDSLGHFKFDRLGPGPHSLVVDAPGFTTARFDHDLSRDGYSVTVRLN